LFNVNKMSRYDPDPAGYEINFSSGSEKNYLFTDPQQFPGSLEHHLDRTTGSTIPDTYLQGVIFLLSGVGIEVRNR
jgi:hypothetical protein